MYTGRDIDEEPKPKPKPAKNRELIFGLPLTQEEIDSFDPGWHHRKCKILKRERSSNGDQDS